tara:strand:+ start:287 stop:448 length:162 start_codon:yes stop_codon:yes gene_type:complete
MSSKFVENSCKINHKNIKRIINKKHIKALRGEMGNLQVQITIREIYRNKDKDS